MLKSLSLSIPFGISPDVIVIREFVWAPSSGIFPNGLGGNDGDDEDGYRPSLIDLDMEEASGDSEDASVISPISY
ncbi:hypothetical protein V6N12_031029 [Hibiscus sabdariffa]|uniref:Uncharacterized protein n=1 Tax=Hibiscus sabdariffa TaxID=183260 RepID=A0ABR2E7Q6_9ROSI